MAAAPHSALGQQVVPQPSHETLVDRQGSTQRAAAAFDSSTTTPRLSLDHWREKMESNDTRRESLDPYDFQTRHDNASFNDSSEENIATEKDLEKDLEADLERHGDG